MSAETGRGEDVARDFHHHDPQLLADPWPAYERFREDCPVAHSDRYDGFWILSRYEDVLAAARDTETFSSASGVGIPAVGLPMPLLPFESDPPRHTQYRHLLMKRFSPDAVAELEPYAVAAADELMDAFAGTGRCDLVNDYALPLTSAVFGQLLTLPPSDRVAVAHWTNRIMERASDPTDAAAALDEFVGYLDRLIHERREDPRDDIVGVLLDATIDGEPLSHDELLSMCFTFVLAGLETTIISMGASMVYLARHPDLRARLAQDEHLLEAAVEEFLRFEPPAQGHARTLTRDVELHGQRLPKGDRVLLLWAAANRDPREFDDPDAFRTDRHPNRHFTFGAGPHRCVGSHLARMEVRVALDRLLRRFPSYAIADEASIVNFKPARAPRQLPVVLS